MAIDDASATFPSRVPLLASFGLVNLISIFCVLYAVYSFAWIVYNVYYHPLAKFPGPKLRAASSVPYYWDLFAGNLDSHAKELHDKYGDTVRINPNELSFITAQAWKDIYGHRPGKPQLRKDPEFYIRMEDETQIINANHADHSRFRRLLAHAFSDQAMREQEPLIVSYVNLLMQKLHEQIKSPNYGIIDIVRWYNFTTFDIIGDLTFGQPFGSLESGDYHYWISNIFQGIKLFRVVRVGHAYPIIGAIFKALITLYPKATESRKKHRQYTREAAARRLATKSGKKDFMSYILRHNDEKGMSESEIKANCSVLLIAGSETTATILSGVTYYLCQNSDVLRKVADEVRTTFPDESAITLTSVAQLPYLQAVIDEGFRLYPPVPAAMLRVTPPEGDIINGQFVPGNTSVGVNQLTTYQSSSNFRDPEKFDPERWLGDPRYAKDQRAALQPFSVGPRNCIGKNLAYAELRIILSRMLWNFDMELCEESANWKEQKTFTLWDKPGLFVKLTARKI